MVQQKETILFFPIHPSSWTTMRSIALEVQEEGIYEPVIFLTKGIVEKKSFCDEHNIKAFLLDANIGALTTSKGRATHTTDEKVKSGPGVGLFANIKRALFSIVKTIYQSIVRFFAWLEKVTNKKILYFSIYHLLRSVVELGYYIGYKRIIENLFDELRPKAAFMYTDGGGGFYALLGKIFMERDIKLIIPAAAFQHENIPVVRRFKYPYFRVGFYRTPWLNMLIKKLFPEQIQEIKGKKSSGWIFYMPYEIIAMSILGTLPPYPWVRGKNYCHYICIEDYYQKRRLLSLGVDENKIAVIGHIECDSAYEASQKWTRSEFNRQHGFDDQKKTIIIALPQLYHEGYFDDWDKFLEELDFIVESAAKTDQNVLLVLHPKMKKDRYRYLEERYNCRIFEGKTGSAIPFGDIYVSAGSSTAFWATAYGLIVVDIVTFYGHEVEMFTYMTSLIPIRERAEYPKKLLKLTRDDVYFKEQMKKVDDDKRNLFLPIDGNNGKRFLSLIDGRDRLKEVERGRVAETV